VEKVNWSVDMVVGDGWWERWVGERFWRAWKRWPGVAKSVVGLVGNRDQTRRMLTWMRFRDVLRARPEGFSPGRSGTKILIPQYPRSTIFLWTDCNITGSIALHLNRFVSISTDWICRRLKRPDANSSPRYMPSCHPSSYSQLKKAEQNT
jgi:hypothetical protein